MDEIGNFIHRLKPALIMVVVQVAYGGVNVLYKLAANDGMSLSVIVAYRFIFATVFMVPLALILERFAHFLSLYMISIYYFLKLSILFVCFLIIWSLVVTCSMWLIKCLLQEY